MALHLPRRSDLAVWLHVPGVRRRPAVQEGLVLLETTPTEKQEYALRYSEDVLRCRWFPGISRGTYPRCDLSQSSQSILNRLPFLPYAPRRLARSDGAA